jgi:hypothetical protein
MTSTDLLYSVLRIFDFYKDNSRILEELLKKKILHPSFEQKYILNNVDFQFTQTHIDFKDDNSMFVF